jgi:acetylornithine/N-succinyldiaminopimelate aminotransferase
MGAYLAKGLAACKERHRVVREVRGLGLLQGIDLDMDGKAVVSECLARGILINATGEHVLRFVPPLIITQLDIDRLLDTLDQIFSTQAA